MSEKSSEQRRDKSEMYPKQDSSDRTKISLGKTAISGRDQDAKKQLGKTAVKGSASDNCGTIATAQGGWTRFTRNDSDIS